MEVDIPTNEERLASIRAQKRASGAGKSHAPAVPTVTRADVRALLHRGNGGRLAFAREIHDPVALARWMAGFANSAGGVILVGADPSTGITGCDVRRTERVYGEALKHLSPRPLSAFHPLPLGDQTLAIIRVTPADKLVLAAGGAFLREGSRTVAMAPADIARLALQPVRLYDRGGSRVPKSAPQPRELEGLIQTTVEPLAKAIAEQTRIIERLQQDLAVEVSLQNRVKEWLIGAVLGAVAGQILAVLFG